MASARPGPPSSELRTPSSARTRTSAGEGTGELDARAAAGCSVGWPHEAVRGRGCHPDVPNLAPNLGTTLSRSQELPGG